MAVGAARRVDLDLLADVLPDIEACVLIGAEAEPDEPDDEGGE
ncbi:hypothetical protein PQ455_01460 [Sphingomonas naphthae]|uniref:Uncharacterized protein n=1 Tax=Sphingomonas naphthae TaxID=1813468 RepID=A0ABY7TLQ7_9SPHN|nr:hypothetical protein [Sphingomonas naphthae]WCT73928.1 hypothetical protein PQ455_01460 [Sphingomonas naphthae]